MNLMTRFLRRISLLFNRKQFAGELDEEMSFHRAQVERDLVAQGMNPAAAHSEAARQFGNATLLREQSHAVVAFRAETVMQDLHFTIRQLRQKPGFSLTAILILALGMGVSVAIFGFVDAALLQPLPYADPNRLMSVDESAAVFPRSNLSYDDYEDWKRLNRSFSSIDVYTGNGYLLRGASGTEPVPAARVSDGFFTTLGVKPLLGRVFAPGEGQPGRAKIVMLSYGTWLKRFGARNDVVGQSVNLSGDAYTIVGVLPRDFAFAPRGNSEFWVPLLDKIECEKRRSCHNLDGIGRLRDGVTPQAAMADLQAIAAQLEKEYPDSNKGQGVSLLPLSEIIVGNVRPILLTLLGGAGLLLLIACVNVASLLLVRSESRRREIAVRSALGATRARLMRQFVTEGLVAGKGGLCCGLPRRLLDRDVDDADDSERCRAARAVPFRRGIKCAHKCICGFDRFACGSAACGNSNPSAFLSGYSRRTGRRRARCGGKAVASHGRKSCSSGIGDSCCSSCGRGPAGAELLSIAAR